MAIDTYSINNSFEALKTALEASDLFTTVSIVDDEVCCYDGEDLVFKVFYRNDSYPYHMACYYNNGNSNSSAYSVSNHTNLTNMVSAYVTPHGIMIRGNWGSGKEVALIITKDNNDRVVCVFTLAWSGNTLESYSTTPTATRFDSPNANWITYTHTNMSQTLLVPFVVNVPIGATKSYTPNAYWIPASENKSIGWCAIVIDGVQYMTNGFWALKDVDLTA